MYVASVPSASSAITSCTICPTSRALVEETTSWCEPRNESATTLASALSGKLNPAVNLVETLNTGEFTVFAPTDDAFAKLDPATIDKLKTDSKLLSSILTYHVVSGQADPTAVVGEHKTVQGESLKVTGSGDTLKVNDAGVVCGGIKTANATLYLIDTVLMPPAAPATTPTPTPTP